MKTVAGMIIDVRPGARPGTYTASLGGRDLCTSRQPLLDSARFLIQEGADPADVLVMRWAETGTESLTATVGTAAKLTVADGQDGVPRFRSYKPYSGEVAPPMRSISTPATLTNLSSLAA